MGTLRRRLLRETHDPQWAGHPGIDRMVALLARRYYWPRMEEDVEAYVRICLVCQLDKVERKKEAGLLQPLPIPEVSWQSISMDFISGFPKIWKKINSKSVHRGLIPKYDGPFEDLLDTARQQTQRAPPVIQKEFEKTVLKILDHRTMGQSKKNIWTNYLVHWSGESEANATWERDVTLWQFEEKLDEYWVVREGVTPLTRASGSSGGGGL
ncbi:UNVERIFIED_CONTAM: hypothetical protein Scaly_2018900 [Sesamum calycinum]|uniref:Chromo domain-containing protein n=1 Tax=Sesamum calycinum TaxID=2727403 RepID=A0AAW2N318_9LAMI